MKLPGAAGSSDCQNSCHNTANCSRVTSVAPCDGKTINGKCHEKNLFFKIRNEIK